MPAAIFEAVLGNLALAAALALLAFVVGWKGKRPAVAHALWLLVLLKFITPPLFTVPLRILPAREVAEVPPALPRTVAVPVFVPSAVAVSLPAPAPVQAAPPAPAGWSPSPESVLLSLWVFGSVLSAAVAAKRVRRFGKLLSFGTPAPVALVAEVEVLAARMGLRRAPRVRVVPGGVAPLVWAVGRPTLYLPAALLPRLSAEQRLTLLAHELAHLRRWDHLVRAIEFAAVAVFWWCPLAWVARRELRRLEEEACDADVTATLPDSGYAYASAIVETIDYVAGVPTAPTFASAIGDAKSLRRRLVHILEGRNAARTTTRARAVLVLGGLALLAVGAKFDRLSAATRTPPPIGDGTAFTSRALLPRPADAEVELGSFPPAPTTLFAVGNGCGAAARSPDGTKVAVAVGRVVRVFDERTSESFDLTGHAGTVNAVAFSPDGARLATAASDGTAKLWRAADGRLVRTFLGHTEWVTAVAFSPSGLTLATGSYDRTVRTWDAESGGELKVMRGHTGGVRAVAFAPNGRMIASGAADHTVRLWTAAGGRVALTLKKHTAAVRAVAFTPDGSHVASASDDRTVRLSQIADGREVGQTTLPEVGTTLAFAPRGEALFVGTGGGHVVRLNPNSGRVQAYLGVEPGLDPDTPAHAAGVTAVLPSADGSSLKTVGNDGGVLSWSANEAESAGRSFVGNQRPTAVCVSPDGKTLAVGGQDGVVKVLDAATGVELLSIPAHTGSVISVAFGSNGRLVSAGTDERVRVWDATSGAGLLTLIQTTADLRVAVSPDGKSLAVGGRNIPGVMLVNLNSSAQPRRVGGALGDVSAVAFSPRGDCMATGYASGMVRFWDTATGQELARSSPRTGCVDAVAFAPDGGSVLAAVNADPSDESGPVHETIVVDARTGVVRAGVLNHPAPVTGAAVAGDGRVVTAAHDGNVYVWDEGRAVRVVRGHAGPVRGVALAADGSGVYTAGDRAAKRWNLK